MWWQLWWVWLVAGGVLGILELLVPAFVFLGFACGAVLTGLLLSTGLITGSAAGLVFLFAVASLLCWLGLRAIFGRNQGQVKVIHKDINEN